MKKKDIPEIQYAVKKDALEIDIAIAKDDEQIVEGYSFLSKARQRTLAEKYGAIMEFDDAQQKSKNVIPGASYSAIFAVCKKYNVIRCFIGNVQLDGNKVSASDSFVMTFKSKVKVEDVIGKTFDEVMEFIKLGKKSPRPVNTISGNTVDAVMKF